MGMIEEIFDNDPLTVLHLSPVCKSFSKMATKEDKQRKIENMDSTLDMVFPSMDLVKASKAATVIVEQVADFATSEMCYALELQLKRTGYFVHKKIIDPLLHGGLTSRKRCYIVATVFDGYEFPEEKMVNSNVWDLIDNHFPDCKDATDLSSVKKSLECGRARIIKPNDLHSPTIMASQFRGTKDAVRFMRDGRIYNPSLGLCADIMGIENFPEALLTGESAAEVIGNGVEVNSHTQLIESVKTHLQLNSKKPLIKLTA